MVRESVCTMATIQVSDAEAEDWLGICLKGATASDVDHLVAMIARWRQHAELSSCSRVAGGTPTSTSESSGVPLVSIGPSGLGGPYQREF